MFLFSLFLHGRLLVARIALRPTSTSVDLVGDVHVCQMRMLFSNRACAQGERAGRRPKLLKVEDGLYGGRGLSTFQYRDAFKTNVV